MVAFVFLILHWHHIKQSACMFNERPDLCKVWHLWPILIGMSMWSYNSVISLWNFDLKHHWSIALIIGIVSLCPTFLDWMITINVMMKFLANVGPFDRNFSIFTSWLFLPSCSYQNKRKILNTCNWLLVLKISLSSKILFVWLKSQFQCLASINFLKMFCFT